MTTFTDRLAEDVARRFFAMSPAARRAEAAKQDRAIVGSARVVPELRQVVTSTLRLAVHHLELPPIRIRWLVMPRHARSDDPRIGAPAGRQAFTDPIDHPTEIYLSAFAPTPVATILHEARHLWQYQDGWFPGRPCAGCTELDYSMTPERQDEVELDAQIWAAMTMRELHLAEYPPCEARGLVR